MKVFNWVCFVFACVAVGVSNYHAWKAIDHIDSAVLIMASVYGLLCAAVRIEEGTFGKGSTELN